MTNLFTTGESTGARRRFKDPELRRRSRTGTLLLGAHVVAGTIFLVWLAGALDLAHWYLTVPFFVAEVLSFAATTLYGFTIRRPRTHPPEGIAGMPEVLGLDVWICTAGEPAEVLEPTVVAAMRIRYPRKRVFVLDDRGSAEAQRIARQYGAGYVARDVVDDAKAGNLNHALRTLGSDDHALILALDADQVPDPELMQRLAGYFRFPRVAFVQSAQRFVLPNGDPFRNDDALFYCVMQATKDADNAAFSCGSGVVYRRAALEAIGGFSTWNVVEDVHTSMRLHGAGWTSIYHPYALTTGTAPADIVAYTRQRRQWAIDSLRMLFWDNPLRHHGLTGAQQRQYLYTGIGYLVAGLLLPIYFVTPGIVMLGGISLTTGGAGVYALYRGICLVFTLGMIAALQHPIRGLPYFRMWAGGFSIHFQAIVAAVKARTSKPAYRVTSKVHGRTSIGRRLRCVAPHLAILALTAAGVYRAWSAQTLPTDALLVNTAWALWAVWAVTGMVGAAFQSRTPILVPAPVTREKER